MITDPASLLGTEIGGYRLDSFLGQGLTGAVYQSTRVGVPEGEPNPPVALKVFFPPALKEEERAILFRRFQREAEILSGLNHPHIMRILGYGEDQDYTYIVLPLAQGGTLSSRILAGPMPVTEIVRLLQQISAALDYAHQRDIVHRDIKPSNILLDEQGNALLADFSIAKQLDSTTTSSITRGNILGTFQYMAPEQANGDNVGPSADLYSLAVVVYQMVTGNVPFKADTSLIAFFGQLMHQPPPPPRMMRPDLPEPAEAVLLKALSKTPAERFTTASAFTEAFEIGLQNQWPAGVEPVTPFATNAAAGYGGATAPYMMGAAAGYPGQPSPYMMNPATAYAGAGSTDPTLVLAPRQPDQRAAFSPILAGGAAALVVVLIAALIFGLGLMAHNSGGSSGLGQHANTPSATFTIPPTIPPTYTPLPTLTVQPTSAPQPTPTPIPTPIPPTPIPPTPIPPTPIPPTPIPPTPIPPTPIPPGPTCPAGYNCMDDSSLYYSTPNWQHETNRGNSYYAGSQSYIGPYYHGAVGDYAYLSFNGTQILYYVVVDNHHGYADLVLDGVDQGSVDLYRNFRQGFYLVWTSPFLNSGTHTLYIYYTNTKNAASSDTVITIDAFAVRP